MTVIGSRPVGIVGDGPVARHFTHYLTLLGVSVRRWSRRGQTEPPPETLASCDTVLLLIRDAAIVSFVESWPALTEKRLVHFSGSLTTPLAVAAHPLTTFGPDLYDLSVYRRIPFVLETGGPALNELLPALPNPSFSVPAAARPYYHALCVMAGNFSTLLWLKLFDELEARFRIPSSAAHLYLTQVTVNLLAGANRALTGPLSRGDFDTIDSNLRALEGDEYHAIS